MAKPLYTEVAPELSTSKVALVPPDHAEMVPSSVEKMKCEPPKPEVPLKTWPVGADDVPPAGGGIETTNPCLTPKVLERVASPTPLSLTQNGLLPENATPHGL